MGQQDNKDCTAQECWDKALYTFGTARIFEKRTATLQKKLRFLSFLGLAMPLLVGGVVTSFGLDFKHIGFVLVLTSIVGLLQLIVSLWALVDRWEDALANSTESLIDNDRLSREFSRFAQEISRLPRLEEQHKLIFERLITENSARANLDIKQNVSEREKRFGMRAGLRQYKRKCTSCDKIPQSLKPTKCPICGRF